MHGESDHGDPDGTAQESQGARLAGSDEAELYVRKSALTTVVVASGSDDADALGHGGGRCRRGKAVGRARPGATAPGSDSEPGSPHGQPPAHAAGSSAGGEQSASESSSSSPRSQSQEFFCWQRSPGSPSSRQGGRTRWEAEVGSEAARSTAGSCFSGRVSEEEVTMHFARWADKSKWNLMRALFDRGQGSSGGRLPRERFVAFLRKSGYAGSHRRVFVQMEHSGPAHDRRDRGSNHFDEKDGREVSLAQFQHFQRKCAALLTSLPMWDESSACCVFIRKLRHERGCLLRAWHLDLDRGGTGLVPHADFVAVCKRHGMVKDTKLIWKSLRPNGNLSPLEFRELDSDESFNFECFVEALTHSCGLDLNAAWACMDTHGRGVITLEEFVTGARKLDFVGDPALLFRGLDTSGLGRVWRKEFDYVKILSLASVRARRTSPSICTLQSWVQKGFDGGANAFLREIGFTRDCSSMDVSEFAHRLEVLGHATDCLQTAAVVARAGGSSQVLRSTLLTLLTANTSSVCSPKAPTSNGKKTFTRSQAKEQWQPQVQWNGSVDDFSLLNMKRPVQARTFFSNSKGLGQRSCDSPSSSIADFAPPPRRQQERWQSHERLESEWDGSICHITELNVSSPVQRRRYFDGLSPTALRSEEARLDAFFCRSISSGRSSPRGEDDHSCSGGSTPCRQDHHLKMIDECQDEEPLRTTTGTSPARATVRGGRAAEKRQAAGIGIQEARGARKAPEACAAPDGQMSRTGAGKLPAEAEPAANPNGKMSSEGCHQKGAGHSLDVPADAVPAPSSDVETASSDIEM